ncbi:MAG: hypothetical protein AAF449_20795 [Myxococcota bacterium]
MTGKKASAEDEEIFKLLSERWREKEIAFDPRLIGDWSFEVGHDGARHLHCDMELPQGVEAEVTPPIEKRVAIGGKFLDETQIRLAGMPGTIAMLGFPLKHHTAVTGDDGSVTIQTKMPTAVALFAEGILPPVGGAAVQLIVQGEKHDAMALSEIRCDRDVGYSDVVILFFKPAPAQ